MKATLMFSTGFVAAMLALAPTDATAIHRGSHSMTPEEYDRYCGRLPSYGFDGCGYREFSYGDLPLNFHPAAIRASSNVI